MSHLPHGVTVALVLVVGLVAGLLAGVTLFDDDGPAPPERPVVQEEPDPELVASPLPAGERLDVAAATSPEAAVSGFLAAEAQGDFTGSFAFTSSGDRRAYPSSASWVAAHADLAPVTGFRVEAVREGSVETTLTLASRLDPVLGLIPARALATWPTVAEDGGFRVHLGGATMQPQYPPDDGAAEAADRWATARTACETSDQAGPLLGAPDLADQLCGADAPLDLGPIGPLTEATRTTPLLEAYGPEVYAWARTIDVRAPVPMTIVLAPIADTWSVMAVLPRPT